MEYLRVACAVPQIVVGDVDSNVEEIKKIILDLQKKNVQVMVFPELCITGYTCQDLFGQSLLLSKALEGAAILAKSVKANCFVYVGLPVKVGTALYNCAAVLNDGKICCIVPKTYIPNYSEFYEKRWFTPFDGKDTQICFNGQTIKVSSTTLFKIGEGVIGCELCEDVWVPLSPSTKLALNGANVIVNLSAGNEVIGKADYRRSLIAMNSGKNICAYVYANAGTDESTQDLVFSGHSLIAEYGTVLEEIKPFENKKYIISDVDIERLNHERMHNETFNQPTEVDGGCVIIDDGKKLVEQKDFYRSVNGHPFVPADDKERTERARAITTMQSYGLVKRLKHINASKVVIGISGGLDSTLAFLVACQAFDILGLDRKGINGITMPGFGTTGRTYENAKKLVQDCGATLVEISIKDAATNHLKDLNHSLDVHDITYENAQARERTQVLFDYANMHNAILIGTGDLSELALGWCTYNGDQMSNYGVNVSIPKTLVKWLVKFYADNAQGELQTVLNDIIDTPVSPELLPPDENGNIVQKTENTIGSYELHDFFLYNLMRNGYGPEKIFFLAKQAVKQGTMSTYNDETIKETMQKFYRRFFSQQFKRSCMPDGVKVGTISLSPRGDWRMPSDASAAIWLKEVEKL